MSTNNNNDFKKNEGGGKSLKFSASNAGGTNDFDVALLDKNLWYTAWLPAWNFHQAITGDLDWLYIPLWLNLNKND